MPLSPPAPPDIVLTNGNVRRLPPPSSPAEGVAGSAVPGSEPVTALRAGQVDVDGRRVARVLAGMALAALAVTTVVLFVSGAHRNAQIDRLHQHGVPVEITVTGCLGQLGGSGSNAAGYACTGSFVLQGRHVEESIPGTTLYRPGTKLRAVAVPGDPALVTPTSMLSGERATATVYVLPGCLAALFVATCAAVWFWRRRVSSARTRRLDPISTAAGTAAG